MSELGIARPRFVTTEEALAWHETGVAQYGGSSGLRDAGLLESALAMPRQGFSGQFMHSFPFEMAAAYAFHIAKNHPFVDGNKRAALLCCGGFLRMNGWNLLTQGTESADAVLALIDESLDKVGFATWLQEHTSERPKLELRDFFQRVRLSDFQEHVKSILATTRLTEIESTFREALDALPMAAELARALYDEMKSNNDNTQDSAFVLMVQLVAIYRLAEDMGYEW